MISPRNANYRHWFRSVANHRVVSLALVAGCALLLNLVLALVLGIPTPHVHDEFSYLLAADTFAHGSLTNPPHPLWMHFESMHIIQQPTYASKYPPGQGLALAAGQFLTGQPIVGVWLSTALACAAICWMLRAWVSPRWAFLGGLLAAIHPTVLEWSHNYWGGSVAMAGGALVLAAAERLRRGQGWRNAALLALGMAILANSRPYEGVILCLVVLVPLVGGWLSQRSLFDRGNLVRLALTITVVLAANFLWMAFYNYRVTGHWLRMPYAVHEETYAIVPSFLWQQPRGGLVYRHAALRDFWLGWVWNLYMQQRTPWGLLNGMAWKASTLVRGSFSLAILAVGLLALPGAVKHDRRMRLALGQWLVFAAALLPTVGVAPHYAAPAMSLGFVMGMGCLRRLRLWWVRGKPLGRWLFLAGLAASAAVVVGWALGQVKAARQDDLVLQFATRAALVNQLQQQGGRHLLVVRYDPGHSTHAEWVYNNADIDRAPVVWAREMDETENRRLLDYFRERRVWLVEPDAQPPRWTPYREASVARR